MEMVLQFDPLKGDENKYPQVSMEIPPEKVRETLNKYSQWKKGNYYFAKLSTSNGILVLNMQYNDYGDWIVR
jgi:hypothetical protein